MAQGVLDGYYLLWNGTAEDTDGLANAEPRSRSCARNWPTVLTSTTFSERHCLCTRMLWASDCCACNVLCEASPPMYFYVSACSQ
eukprot:3664580-Amphidinium_carterae.1